MKIGELLQLTQTKSLEEIAKTKLSIGKNAARDALKAAGCYSRNGVKGWFHDDLETVAEREIYEFSAVKKAKPKSNASKLSINKSKEKENAVDVIDRILFQKELESDSRIYRGFYLDADIVNVIDSVRHGSKSELVNEILRKVLQEKGLLK